MNDARILIVEDEGIAALDLQHRLTIMGHAVEDIVATGEEAVIKAEETHPDLVLMDIMLQGDIDGVQAAEQIHARLDIPVIFLTAYSDENTLQRAKITEPYGYLVKPFKERDLRISIDMALYKHKMEKRLKESGKKSLKLNEELRRNVAGLSVANASLRDARRATLNIMDDLIAARKRTEEASAELRHEVEERKRAEEELKQRNEDLMRFNTASVGRELRMIELKKEVNELCGRAGEAPRYSFEIEKEQQ